MSLGATPIILGSGNQAHIYLSQQQGYYPETAKIFQQGEQIIMEYNSDYGHAKNMKNLTHYLNNGTTRKFGEIRIEIQTDKALSEPQTA